MFDANSLARALMWWIYCIAAVAFAAGVLVVWGLPKLWAILKPWIHQVTG